jgi:arginyl-tRNA synthetase
MLHRFRQELATAVGARIRKLYGVEHRPVVEIPPRRELGDLAFPAALHLARELKKPPRAIGEELAAGFEPPDFVRRVRVEGPGYLNMYLDRSRSVALLLRKPLLDFGAHDRQKVVVEHTNINPNKAAHIGHLRNAVLGDVVARLLRALGHPVEVQNYIDDTGVQLADVVVGFLDLRRLEPAEIAALPEPFDYHCWDLYSEVRAWLEEDPERQQLRAETLLELERGEGRRAEAGRLVARRIVGRHLATMRRIGVGYDLLTHESAILGLDFFARAFTQLRERGAIHLEQEGKNAGCWVMPLSQHEEFAGLEDPDKVIVRSDGTVTYVGKDIAYQLWKLGLLGRDFEYRRWPEEEIWETATEGEAEHPEFGNAWEVVNVIDARQSYLQKIVKAGVAALGFQEAAERSVHFAYEMVSLSAATASQMGFLDDAADGGGKNLEMSGRRGIGVKADDLLDRLIAKSRDEIASRNRDLAEEELTGLASRIATAALRFFMVKATTTRMIAFDFDEALSFEGDSGPYLQYSAVRARNIRRRLADEGVESEVEPAAAAELPAEVWADDLWDLALAVALIPDRVRQAGEALEPSLVARHALDLAQKFNAVYHRHPILQEPDVDLRRARLAATGVFARGMAELCSLMGIERPERM